jgi:hypothetical protein
MAASRKQPLNPAVKQKYDSYPGDVRAHLLAVRECLFDIASSEGLGDITEALKWGEPSYQALRGSPVRLGWKPKSPHDFSIFFNCRTSLIETFREVFPNTFKFVGNREIVFSISEQVPLPELRCCLSMALRYHRIKGLPLLGA